MNGKNTRWGFILIIFGILGLYHSYSNFMSYQEIGKVSYIVKHVYFTGNKALILNYGNTVFSIILLYCGYLLVKKSNKPNKNEETNNLP